MIASALGARVVAVDITEDKLDLARQIGAEITIVAESHTDVSARVRDLTDGGVHVSIDALGSPVTCFNSIDSLRKRGKHVQIGLMLAEHRHPKIPMDKVIAHELEILGSHGMQAHRYGEMLEMILAGKLEPGRLVDRTISLAEAPEALAGMDEFPGRGVTVIDLSVENM
jgi:alcohol dehydrogenase